MCLFAGGRIYKRQAHSADTTDYWEEFINTCRETVNMRGLQQKKNWSNIGNPFPIEFEPLLIPYLGDAGVQAMAAYRKNAIENLGISEVGKTSTKVQLYHFHQIQLLDSTINQPQ